MTTDIERLAKEAGGVLESWMTNPPTPAQFHFKPEQLAKFAALIAEECGKVCEAYVWWKDDFRSPDESNEGCAAAIRAKFPMPTHSDTKDAAK